MHNVKIMNTAPTRRKQWVTVAVPTQTIAWKPDGSFGMLKDRGWPACVSWRNPHSAYVHVLAEMDGFVEITDKIIWPELQKGDEVPKFKVPEFKPGLALVVHRHGVEHRVDPMHTKVETLLNGPVLKVLKLTGRFPGRLNPLMARIYGYVYGGQEMIRFNVGLFHSSTRSSNLMFDIDALWLESDEFLHIDDATALGARGPTFVDGKWRYQLLGPTDLADGVHPEWQGWLHPNWEDHINGIPETSIAQTQGDIVGCYTDGWYDGWLSLGASPRPHGYDPEMDIWTLTAMRQQFPGEYWDDRPAGMTRDPGSAGGQAGLGPVRGSEAAGAGNPPVIAWMARSITSHLRPQAYYTHHGELVTVEAFNRWRTWSGRTHPLPGFQETLGKPLNSAGLVDRPDTQGWKPTDEQHRGQVVEDAYYALTGELWVGDIIRERIEVWLAAWNESAGRAIGRTWVSMVNAWRLTGDKRILEEIRKDFEEIVVPRWEKLKSKPVPAWEITKDRRALRTPDGEAVECINFWQLGLLAPGAWAAARALQDARFADFALANADTVVRHGFFRDNLGRWRVLDYAAYRDGQTPDAGWYANNGNVPGVSHSTGWFTSWVIAAVQLVEGNVPDLKEKAQQILLEWQPTNWTQAQWAIGASEAKTLGGDPFPK